ncbi:SRP40, C-terminal domain-domain-containing protein, partial [Catenaria anguillulae PL171]
QPQQKKPRVQERFQRVNPAEVEFANEAVKDNSYRSHGSYGDRAHRDLVVTRGKSFRAEKTKKKRGSYRGGVIDTSANCIKLGSDS